MSFIRRWLLHLSIPVQRLMQKLTRPDPQVQGHFFRSVDGLIQPSDVLLSQERWHFTNYFIPGFWGHVAILASKSLVVEAVGSGVRSVELAQWILQKDAVLILRPNFGLNFSADFVYDQIGKPYDYEFSSGVDSWFCSELVWYCLGSPDFEMRETFGVKTVTPQDFENAVKVGKFIVIADSRLSSKS